MPIVRMRLPTRRTTTSAVQAADVPSLRRRTSAALPWRLCRSAVSVLFYPGLIGATLESGFVILLDFVALLAGVTLVSAFYCQTPSRIRVLAILSSVLFIWYAVALDMIPLLALSVGTAVINLIRLVGFANSRYPTRKMWKMDRDVTNRVRDIQAESRNSSAGIEF